jgi:hypothetical protein
MISLPEHPELVFSGPNGNPRLEIGLGKDAWAQSVLAVRTYDFLEESEVAELQPIIDSASRVANLPRVQRVLSNLVSPGMKSRKFMQ